jgi:murein DD-endopeptidase MepM/ murein hydrolase activator NlpD
MRCGTPLYAARRFRVVSNDSLGPAYGAHPLRLRNRKLGWDLVIGHTRRVYVREGQVVRRGTMFARASDSGAPDGCHLHFEKRAVGGGLSTASWPRPLLHLTPRRTR